MTRYLVLLETAGNQRFIFATNKLRENVGASELTCRAGKEWVEEAANGRPVRVILPTSGKAYLLAESENVAREVIRTVTTRAIREAPGLDLSGVFVGIDVGGLDSAIQAAHKRLAARRGTNPGPEARFQRLPVVAECATSGLPAAKADCDPDGRPQDRSAVSIAKRDFTRSGIRRMQEKAAGWSRFRIVDNPEKLDKLWGSQWLAVVHADGNGLGKVFSNFGRHAQTESDDVYIRELPRFSKALDRCTDEAFGSALDGLGQRLGAAPGEQLPVAPIVLGGDDMTIVLEGRFAVQFAIDFLKRFESLTGSTLPEPFGDVIPKTMLGPDRKGPGRVSACAGVAVVKPHFPFYAAYELAEELIQSAKKYAKGIDEQKPPSAIDFHILYDASGADLERIREFLRLPDGVTELVARPYLVSDDAGNRRSTTALKERMATIRARDEDRRRAIPNSQLHELRAALFLGKAAAEARLGLVRDRYPALKPLLVDEKDLFWTDGKISRTHLLDAMDLFDFWADEPKEGAP